MDTSTRGCKSCASSEHDLPFAIGPLRDASATPRPLPGHVSVTDDHGASLPNLEQPTLNPSNCVIIVQNNFIAEGGPSTYFQVAAMVQKTHLVTKAVTKLNHVTTTAEPTPLQPPSARQTEPAEHGHETIVMSGNTFGECVMINVGSPDCTGAVKQTALASQTSPI
ncbi:uncharacterized protein BJ212DRAFT_1301371 [Suillus subaureus]|uniref:Uncharacterized protein n=1 Tax=Suillus subaureus TaxID=48587 RepID=A0A9P7E7R9_9AGAM|nr:uncharacterized protein BJ212DRAFT_1301371 [Suillus subaureus]KAG1812902.1 hypothetical protein BJ212DRAFT_1301371 [Suillus subaureus]